MTFIHETDHALGLTHSHDLDVFGKTPLAHDFQSYTVMSYRGFYGESVNEGYVNGKYDYPQSYMLIDITAL
jgi:serralysin